MIYLVLFIAIVALCCACASLIIAIKERGKKPSTIKTVVRIERAPVEHPFTYDSERTTYTLDGNLEVTGSVTAMKKGGEE